MRRVVLVLVVGFAVAGCGSEAPETAERTAHPLGERAKVASLVAGRSCTAGSERAVGSRRSAYAVVVRGRARAFARPGGRSIQAFSRLNANGVPTVFGVRSVVVGERCEPRWYGVQLPIRPNGARGYVRARAVELYRVRERIEIDLSARTLTFFRNGHRVLRAVVGVGSRATPTPTGRYYVNQRLRAREASGPFGPVAIGVSAFSPVLTGWAQGGPIAIHGTNDPASIGKAVSNGCIRLPNETVRRLYDATPSGTPVVIRL